MDVILFLIEADSKEIGKGDKLILEKLKENNKKVILVINKIDKIEKKELLSLIEKYTNTYNFSAVVPVSALKEEGTEELVCEIEKHLPNGPAYYDKDEYTDQTLKLLNDEVPHGILVEVEKMKNRKTKLKEPICDIEATIYCIRNSHKGIIIGKNGSMLKKIGKYAREDLEKMLEKKVNLKLWVKVKENWQDDESVVKKFKVE